MEDCLFCKIAAKEIPSKLVYEDDRVYAFEDINPQAPTHFLVVPKKHISSAMEVNSSNAKEIAYVYEVIPKIIRSLGIGNGFRVLTNCGEMAGQTVFHIHFHVLAGRELGWPPG
ncbi:MAG: histidine triad nucleotide-binding protein [Clostridiales bacterium]|nr:histidine triad nucleotide-binding protein [Clostridiales bacterium]